MKTKNISKEWLQTKYWLEELTDEEMAKARNVSVSFIRSLISKYGLQKKQNGVKLKGKKGYIMPEHEKAKHRNQKHAKEILVFKVKSKKPIGCFSSIASAATALNLKRQHISACLNPDNVKKTVKGYRFEHKRYKGEILIERRNNLDFSVSFEDVLTGLTVGLPNYPREERIAHFNKKLKNVWETLGYDGKLT
jgi:hypothetical protein